MFASFWNKKLTFRISAKIEDKVKSPWDDDDGDDDGGDDYGDDAAPKDAFVFCFLGTAPDHQSHYPLINGSDLFSLHRASWHDTHPTEGEVTPNCFGEYSSSFYTWIGLVSGNLAVML